MFSTKLGIASRSVVVHITHVVGNCSKNQMIGVHTLVVSTDMPYHLVNGNLTML